MSNNDINLFNLRIDLEQHCKECTTTNCDENSCLVGFALVCLDYAEKAGITVIPGAHTMLPEPNGFEYTNEFTANVLAQTCLECKNCMDNHNQDCIVAITRQCAEKLQLDQNIAYKGNVLSYLVELAKLDADLALRTKDAYEHKKRTF